MIELDGSYLEGGGSIIRIATALSAYTGKPCKIINIRANRPVKGLRAQHLEGLQGLADLCNGILKGAEIGSTEIEFHPGKEFKKNIEINIPTAGSVGLALQAIMIAAVRMTSLHSNEAKDIKEIKIEVRGGATNGKWAAPVNFIKHMLIPILRKMGYKAELEILKYGYYPKGGAHVKLTIHPSEIKPIELLEKGDIISINGISHASIDLKNKKVAERQKESFEKTIQEKLKIRPEIEIKYVDSICTGSAIDIWTKTEHSYLGSSGLGEIRKSAEDVGKEAAYFLIEQLASKASVDEHIEDQLLPFMAISTLTGSSEENPVRDTLIESKIIAPKLTNHTKTNIWVIEKFLPVKFEIYEKTIKCCKL